MQIRTSKIISRTVRSVAAILLFFISLCILYNFYTLFTPINTELRHDEAEHLHALYLLSMGERPYVDFIENHPMLFQHYLNWAQKTFTLESVRDMATFARRTLFIHFILCIAVFCLWTSQLINKRPGFLIWGTMLVSSWAMVDFSHPYLASVWCLRPDFICYSNTLLGSFLFFLWLKYSNEKLSFSWGILLIFAGAIIGMGNAILPKGGVFLIAMLATALCSASIKGNGAILSSFNFRRITGSSIFIISVVVSFLGFMFIDCYLSHIPFEKWIAGVLLINSKKHIIFSDNEDNPITALVSIPSLPFLLLLALVCWVLWELATFKHKEKKNDEFHLLMLFSVLTILTNLLTPSYANHATWSYNFTPSIFAAASIFLLLMLRAWKTLRYLQRPLLLRPQLIAIAVIFAIVGVKILIQPFQAKASFNRRVSEQNTIKRNGSVDYPRDEIMPASFTYFAYYPNLMPVRSRHWGYYFFLADNGNFWRDCYKLGMGPDPEKTFENGFGDNPPDAIVFEKAAELYRYITWGYYCQGLDFTWMINDIKTNYLPMRRRGITILVIKNRVEELEKKGWQKLQPDFIE